MNQSLSQTELQELANKIKAWGHALGFQQVGITDIDLNTAEVHLLNWLDQHYHGEMEYMERHGTKRSRPAELEPGTTRVISARMDYLPPGWDPRAIPDNAGAALISRYALGRDYHKTLRKRLAKLCKQIATEVKEIKYRVYVDSAPVLEKAIAEKAGLGWIGKHTNLINQDAGSWFFLGEIYTDLPLPIDTPASAHCGDCSACIDICPTRAIVAPFQLDARKCISYLTIELKSAIPEELRPLMGTHIYGCDDCQAVCPWNRFAQATPETDFLPRHGLDQASLLELFNWDEATFLLKTEGSAIRRIGYVSWLRNIAVALGNCAPSAEIIAALNARSDHPSELVREHVRWALTQIKSRS
ncbi:MAG: tRNA epoxyqueuosine(34) reductase QueG [bacterium]